MAPPPRRSLSSPLLPEVRMDGVGRVGPAFGAGLGCGVGVGVGFVGGFGLGFGLPGLQFGGGLGAGCGIGIGYGYGVGVGKAYNNNVTISNIGGTNRTRRSIPMRSNIPLGDSALGSFVDDVLRDVRTTIDNLLDAASRR